MAFDLHGRIEIMVDLLNNGGWATETIRYADIVSCICARANAARGVTTKPMRKPVRSPERKGGSIADDSQRRPPVSRRPGAAPQEGREREWAVR
jgi:hypothetical protein